MSAVFFCQPKETGPKSFTINDKLEIILQNVKKYVFYQNKNGYHDMGNFKVKFRHISSTIH